MIDRDPESEVPVTQWQFTPPREPDLMRFLNEKLEKYRNQLSEEMREQGLYPQFDPHELHPSLFYKIEILARLMEHQETIHAVILAAELRERFVEKFDVKKFNSACAVVNDYITTRGANVIHAIGPFGILRDNK